MLRSPRFATLALALVVGAATAAPSARAATTLDHLQAAFDGESNAKARYEAFAKKAEAEGYAGAAALFRSAARAEGIHVANHAAVIKRMGAVPKADVKAPDVKSTRENLQAALEGETYEQEKMYPEFLAQARAEGQKGAIRTFRFARAAEKEHAELYRQALANLDTWKAARKFWVCPECGSTRGNAPAKKCEVCWTKPEKFLVVS